MIALGLGRLEADRDLLDRCGDFFFHDQYSEERLGARRHTEGQLNPRLNARAGGVHNPQFVRLLSRLDVNAEQAQRVAKDVRSRQARDFLKTVHLFRCGGRQIDGHAPAPRCFRVFVGGRSDGGSPDLRRDASFSHVGIVPILCSSLHGSHLCGDEMLWNIG